MPSPYRSAWPILVLLSVLWALPAATQEGATVVVLDVDGGDLDLSAEDRAAMSDRLAGVMSDSGKYNVIPREDFQAALTHHEQETGQPCQDRACQMAVAKSMGAQGAVQPKVNRDGGGCAVSLGVVAGAEGDPMAGSTVKNKCSLKSLSVAMDGAMLGMTHKLVTERPLEELAGDEEPGAGIEVVTGGDAEALIADEDAEREDAQDAEEKEAGVHGDSDRQPADDEAEDSGDESGADQGDPADQADQESDQPVDTEAEERALQREEEAAKKLGW